MTSVYTSAADLKAVVAPGAGSTLDDRLEAAVILGSRYVDRKLANPVAEDWESPPYTLVEVPCPPSWRQAALVAATRFYKSTDAPFGVVGGLADWAVRVRMEIPEVDLILTGQLPALVR